MTATATAPLTMAEWRALPDGPDFRRTSTTYRDGWNGSTSTRTATYAGPCVRCGTRTYTDTGGGDPRGPLGDHAAAPLDPAEYSATGAEVPCCFLCQNDTEEKYHQALRLAERRGDWHYTEPSDPVAECFSCGGPIRWLDGSGYHIGCIPRDPTLAELAADIFRVIYHHEANDAENPIVCSGCFGDIFGRTVTP